MSFYGPVTLLAVVNCNDVPTLCLNGGESFGKLLFQNVPNVFSMQKNILPGKIVIGFANVPVM